MRNYPATLLEVFETKLEKGHDTDDDIPFTKDDLQEAVDELDIDIRDVMEIPSTYSTAGMLPDEITNHGYDGIEQDDSDPDGETYIFTKE